MSIPEIPSPGKHFTTFRSAAEEAVMRVSEAEWDNEGGHMSSTAGRIVRTPGSEPPYKVILTHCGRLETERNFATMREAEEFIRRNTPVPAARRTLYDRPADENLSLKSGNEVLL